ncbi:unnamed protein product [Ascophyllum nodosum]
MSRSGIRLRPFMATFFLLSVLSGRQNIVLAKDHLEKPKVAIVGAGIGGSTASYFLRELMGDDLEIIVFDRSFKTGGRTEHFVRDGKVFETGASIIYTGNEYLFNLTDRVNLTRVDQGKQEGPNTGLWDGERFVLTTTDWNSANIVRMAWRYGMSLLTMNSMVKKALVKFSRIYDLQANGRVFDTPEALWGEVGLLDLTRISTEDYFQERVGQPDPLVEDELAHAANRVNYNQGNELNALAGMVSLCPAVTGDLFKVQGGNARLSEELLSASATEVNLNTAVNVVSGNAKEGYSLHSSGGTEELGTFDAVIIATPISLAGITFDVRGEDNKAETLQRPLPLVEYQEVHTTFVCGVVDRSYFGLRVEDPMPASVLLTESATHLPFSSLARHSWLDDAPDGVGVYKLFSRQELSTELLDSIFVKGSWEIWLHREWRAYPVLSPKEAFSPALLFKGHPVWYVSSLEEGVSALEISAIAAKNAALGVAQTLRHERFSPGLTESGTTVAPEAKEPQARGEL